MLGFVNVFKTNYKIDYIPQNITPTPVVLFRAEDVHEADSSLPEFIQGDQTLGWNDLSTTPVDVHFVPGEHMTILTRPNVTILVNQLKPYFD